jgi:hypothetical protein
LEEGKRNLKKARNSRAKREKVNEGRRTKRIHPIELSPKVTEDRRRWKKAERSLKNVENSREKRGKVDEGRKTKRNELSESNRMQKSLKVTEGQRNMKSLKKMREIEAGRRNSKKRNERI